MPSYVIRWSETEEGPMATLKTALPPTTERNGDVYYLSSGRQPEASNRSRVLLIEQRQSDIREFGWAVRAMHLDGSWVRCGLEGIAALRRTQFDLVVINEALPDMTAGDLVGTLRGEY